MKYLLVFILLYSPFASSQTAENLVVTCNACHGEKGVSINELWPNLKGQKKEYLTKQLKDFRADVRKDPIMNPLSKGLSDEDILKISNYYSELK